ncbi:MAG TPA: pyruvate kinase [Spirochaetia bacterium]|nr:pyruvate kinase [Spirochaetia bacterium]
MKSQPAKTKIIATIGPASNKAEIIVDLAEAGMDIVRLNFSHGTYEEHEENFSQVREAAKKWGNPIPILMDLGGPKLRIGELENEFDLSEGDRIVITTDEVRGTRDRIPSQYRNLARDMKAGETIFLDDGIIELRVDKIKGNDIHCRVIEGGRLKSKKGMNLPGVQISTPTVTDKDKRDVEFGLSHGVDFIALSFVRSSDDIRELRRIIKSHGREVPIIGKIEKPEAISDIDNIIREADGIMVARGDLGVEMKTEEVPLLQKMIIERCLYYNTPVITATQMLESMVKNGRPTRAEASDVANAVLDGTDAVMLSAETSIGVYPLQAVSVMNTICIRTEQYLKPIEWRFETPPDPDADLANDLSKAASVMAQAAKASAIIVVTRSGRTAKLLSKYRTNIPIIAFTENIETISLLKIYWGVHGELIEGLADTDTTLKCAKGLALKLGYIRKGDNVVFVAGIPFFETMHTNMIKLERI